MSIEGKRKILINHFYKHNYGQTPVEYGLWANTHCILLKYTQQNSL